MLSCGARPSYSRLDNDGQPPDLWLALPLFWSQHQIFLGVTTSCAPNPKDPWNGQQPRLNQLGSSSIQQTRRSQL